MAFVFVPAVAAMAPLNSPINIPAMTDLGHYNPQIIVRNLVDNSVLPTAQPIPILAGELLRPRRPRLLRQRFNRGRNLLEVGLWNPSQVPGYGLAEGQSIACHAS